MNNTQIIKEIYQLVENCLTDPAEITRIAQLIGMPNERRSPNSSPYEALTAIVSWAETQPGVLNTLKEEIQNQIFLKSLAKIATAMGISLQSFEFYTGTVNRRAQVINRSTKVARYFTETIPQGISLQMVAIPGGKFIMGSPETEAERFSDESPQHEVTVSPFFMGKYPVTQAQWRVVASLPQINYPLKPDPSYFKGDNLPVETISWYEAVEFCDRLSKSTGRNYRLPSEAEWEYVCRAGTTTPFYFGETITADLANYYAEVSYGDAPKGKSVGQTTPVGSYPPNAFGLYDMHGNVWEWCYDDSHGYKLAPSDGSRWVNKKSDNDNRKMLRGGSWNRYPGRCRCAYRVRYVPEFRGYSRGFRVVFFPART